MENYSSEYFNDDDSIEEVQVGDMSEDSFCVQNSSVKHTHKILNFDKLSLNSLRHKSDALHPDADPDRFQIMEDDEDMAHGNSDTEDEEYPSEDHMSQIRQFQNNDMRARILISDLSSRKFNQLAIGIEQWVKSNYNFDTTETLKKCFNHNLKLTDYQRNDNSNYCSTSYKFMDIKEFDKLAQANPSLVGPNHQCNSRLDEMLVDSCYQSRLSSSFASSHCNSVSHQKSSLFTKIKYADQKKNASNFRELQSDSSMLQSFNRLQEQLEIKKRESFEKNCHEIVCVNKFTGSKDTQEDLARQEQPYLRVFLLT